MMVASGARRIVAAACVDANVAIQRPPKAVRWNERSDSWFTEPHSTVAMRSSSTDAFFGSWNTDRCSGMSSGLAENGIQNF